jgi:hypothetical protein
MLGYGVVASAARPDRAAHSTANNAKVLNVIVLTMLRFIDFPFHTDFNMPSKPVMPICIGFLISPPSWRE